MNVRSFVPESLRRPGPACLAGLTLWALISISFATAMAVEEAKDTRGVTTVGPPVPLSAAQQAKLAAKRAATIIPVPRAEVAPVKPAPISTGLDRVGRDNAPTSLKDKAPIALAPGAAAQARLRELEREDAAIAAFVAALGPDLARRIGLLKPGADPAPAHATPATGGAR